MVGHYAPIILAAIYAGSKIFVLIKLFLPPEHGGFKS